MVEKLASLWPELILMIGGTVCLMMGLAKTVELRQYTSWVAVFSLVIAAGMVPAVSPSGIEGPLGVPLVWAKFGIAAVGVILMLAASYVPQQIRQSRLAESADGFQPGDTLRGEFYFLMLFSLAGAMLCASASDLPWLFLALELTSLPTYVMVATMRDRGEAQESGVKYFFLGALAAAIFLYGFALIYGATGSTNFTEIRQAVADGRAVPDLLLIGLVLSFVGVSFKIAAFPMHFYAADVYEGATTAVTAFLAFVPKAAGFISLALLLGLVGWEPLPAVLGWLVFGVAAVTMTIGNVLALVQTNVKRVLAYSSVAHSGYLLVALLAGGAHGVSAIVFYLVAYGVATIAAFAAIGTLMVKQPDGQEREAATYDDLAGLFRTQPGLAAVIGLSMISLIGLPPLAGFFGKVALFLPAIETGYIALVLIAVINSAISAANYLKIAITCYLGQSTNEVDALPASGRKVAAALSAAAAIALGFFSGAALEVMSSSDEPVTQDEIAIDEQAEEPLEDASS